MIEHIFCFPSPFSSEGAGTRWRKEDLEREQKQEKKTQRIWKKDIQIVEMVIA